MTDPPDSRDEADISNPAPRGQALPPTHGAAEAHQILTSAITLTMAEANKLGLKAVLALGQKQPLSITEDAETDWVLYSGEHWQKIYAATTEATSSSLQALSILLTRLSIDELMTVIDPLLQILEFHKANE